MNICSLVLKHFRKEDSVSTLPIKMLKKYIFLVLHMATNFYLALPSAVVLSAFRIWRFDVQKSFNASADVSGANDIICFMDAADGIIRADVIMSHDDDSTLIMPDETLLWSFWFLLVSCARQARYDMIFALRSVRDGCLELSKRRRFQDHGAQEWRSGWELLGESCVWPCCFDVWCTMRTGPMDWHYPFSILFFLWKF